MWRIGDTSVAAKGLYYPVYGYGSIIRTSIAMKEKPDAFSTFWGKTFSVSGGSGQGESKRGRYFNAHASSLDNDRM